MSLLKDLGVAAADLAQRLHVAIQAGQPEKGREGMPGGLASIACILVGAETGVRLADFLIEVIVVVVVLVESVCTANNSTKAFTLLCFITTDFFFLCSILRFPVFSDYLIHNICLHAY
jgi:hypothetical protein